MNMPRTPVIAEKLLRYITDRPGVVLHKNDIAAELGLTPKQVSDNMYRLRERSGIGDDIQVCIRAASWRYMPSRNGVASVARSTDKAPCDDPSQARTRRRRRRRGGKPMIFEEVGETHDGKVIVRDESNVLYRLEEL